MDLIFGICFFFVAFAFCIFALGVGADVLKDHPACKEESDNDLYD